MIISFCHFCLCKLQQLPEYIVSCLIKVNFLLHISLIIFPMIIFRDKQIPEILQLFQTLRMCRIVQNKLVIQVFILVYGLTFLE